MRWMNICMFLICLNFGFALVSYMDLFNGLGIAGADTTSLTGPLVVGALISGLALGGIVIAGWSFKSSAVLTAFSAIYISSVIMFHTTLSAMIYGMGVSVPGIGVIDATLVGLYAFLGVEASLQIQGTPFGPMD